MQALTYDGDHPVTAMHVIIVNLNHKCLRQNSKTYPRLSRTHLSSAFRDLCRCYLGLQSTFQTVSDELKVK